MFSRRLFERRQPGNGLGAIARLAGDFDIYSMPGKGTAVLARVWPRFPTIENSHGIELGIVSLPKSGRRSLR